MKKIIQEQKIIKKIKNAASSENKLKEIESNMDKQIQEKERIISLLSNLKGKTEKQHKGVVQERKQLNDQLKEIEKDINYLK